VNMWILRPQKLSTSLDYYFEVPNISALLFMFGVNMHLQLDWLTVGFIEPSDLWVLEIKGLEWEAEWPPPTIPLFSMSSWHGTSISTRITSQLLNYQSCSKVHTPFPHNITHLWQYYFL
jgi:hypothetical protein